MSVDLGAIPTTSVDTTILDTFPLNVDPFPYQQLQAQGRYSQILEPDNLPMILSVLSALDTQSNPDMPRTDGKGHLLVTADPSTPLQATPTASFNTNGFVTTGLPFQTNGGTLPKPRYIWAFLFFVGVNPPAPASALVGGFTWAIQGNPSGTRFGFATGLINYVNPSTSTDNMAVNQNIWLPNPIDLSTALPLADTTANVGIATSLAGLTCACSIVYQ